MSMSFTVPVEEVAVVIAGALSLKMLSLPVMELISPRRFIRIEKDGVR